MASKKPFRIQVWELLTRTPYVSKDTFEKAVTQAIENQRRSQILERTEVENKITEPEYDYNLLVRYSLGNEVLRTVHETIIKEVTRNKWQVKPKWESKCDLCGAEFDSKKEECPQCKSKQLREPDPEQKQVLEAFIEDPNPDDEMDDIVKSVLRYQLSVDDWYLSIQYAKPDTPLTVYVEDSVTMRIVADKFGRLGNNEWFCPICTREFPEQSHPKDQLCTVHPDVQLKRTAFVMLKNGFVKARFAKDEMLHSKMDVWLPSLYGNSKIVSCLRIVLSITAMDKFNLDNYATGKLAQMIVFEGMTMDEANDIAKQVEVQKNLVKAESPAGLTSSRLSTLFIGSKGTGGTTKIDAMPPSEKMQSLDWWKLWREAVCAVYGVTPIFTGVIEQGKTGNNPRMQIDVNNNTTEMYQHGFEDPFNNVIVPKLGVTDWEFKFNPVEEKDEMQDITILQTKVETVIRASNAGMNAELTDEGDVKISGKPKPFQPFQQFGQQGEGDQKPAFEGKKPFQTEEVFATEKGLRKKTWIVTEVDKDD